MVNLQEISHNNDYAFHFADLFLQSKYFYIRVISRDMECQMTKIP